MAGIKAYIKMFFVELTIYYKTLLRYIPGVLGLKLRYNYYGKRFRNIGKNVILNDMSIYQNSENISIGDRTNINRFCFINGYGRVIIGSDVMIGPFVMIHSANHNYLNENLKIPINKLGYSKSTTIIENNCWIGAHVSILPGAKIGEGCVIGANSVCVGEYPPNSVLVGAPATVIKKRNE